MNNSFVYQQFFTNLTICDEIIAYHKKSSQKTIGCTIGDDGRQQINLTKKNSWDCILDKTIPEATEYFIQLRYVIEEYVKLFPACSYYRPWDIFESVVIQHYKPGGGYYEWHTERGSGLPPSSTRHLVFMTYLNDVYTGGETEFMHQSLQIKPQKGLTLIWPADWTHTHRGIPAPDEDKYIVTGWFNFY